MAQVSKEKRNPLWLGKQAKGACPKCGCARDDHDGWLSKHGPQCPRK